MPTFESGTLRLGRKKLVCRQYRLVISQGAGLAVSVYRHGNVTAGRRHCFITRTATFCRLSEDKPRKNKPFYCAGIHKELLALKNQSKRF